MTDLTIFAVAYIFGRLFRLAIDGIRTDNERSEDIRRRQDRATQADKGAEYVGNGAWTGRWD